MKKEYKKPRIESHEIDGEYLLTGSDTPRVRTRNDAFAEEEYEIL